MRRIRTVISPTGHISISGNAGLDLTYRELFQSATTELQQGNPKTELGVRLIVFGCFWLEAKCNDTLRKLLEHSIKFGIAATALWEHAVDVVHRFMQSLPLSLLSQKALTRSESRL